MRIRRNAGAPDHWTGIVCRRRSGSRRTTARRRSCSTSASSVVRTTRGAITCSVSAWKSGDLVKSEAAFETALRIDPKHMKSLVNLSRVLVEQKRYDDAIVKLTAAEEVDPESATVPRLMARAHSAKGEFEQAVDAYRRAIALDGSDAWSMNNLGLLYLEHGFIEDALAQLAKRC